MRSKEIKKAIDGLAPWHQRFEMEGQFTTDKFESGEHMWPDIRSLLCEDLTAIKILEIYSNAAYYSVMLSGEGANVTAVEPDKRHFAQGRWTQYFFEEYHERDYPVTFLNKHINDLNLKKFEGVDYVLLSSGFTFLTDLNKKKFIKTLCSITDKIILTTKNDSVENSLGYYNSTFLEHEFYMLKKVVGDQPIMLYGRLIKETEFLEQNNK